VRDAIGYACALVRQDAGERFRREMRLAYFFGFVRARGLGRRPRYQGTSAPSRPRAFAPSTSAPVPPTHLPVA